MDNKINQIGSVVIFSGPHGAGKDTLEALFRTSNPGVERIVRHITRPIAPGETNGQDYHFINGIEFNNLVRQNALIEYSLYPDCMAGTAFGEVKTKLARAAYSSIVTNFEEGLPLHTKLGALGLTSICLFISPVDSEVMRNDPGQYLSVLKRRMEQRNRPLDMIENKLAKAALYRDLYYENENRAVYVNNSDGAVDAALADVVSAVRTLD